ncbi:hypothetical protein [Virgibacillus kimchii]
MIKPNIFTFATGELSQDAFICWSLSWGRQYENKQMRSYGLSLLNAMLEKHQYHIEDLGRMMIDDVANQVNSIDVLVKFRIDEQEFELIIEDKTNTTMHSNQIKRYFDQRKEKNPDKVILAIYYKTGFIFDDEELKLKALCDKNYPVKSFDKEAILNFMRPYLDVTNSDIFHDYYQYIKEKFDGEKAVLQNIYSPDLERLEESLQTPFGQVEAIKSIFGHVPISRGNSYGRPWVHYSFKKGSHKSPLPDRLFYRIDKKKKGFYLSLRQYSNLKDVARRRDRDYSMETLKQNKLERLHELTRIFDDVLTEMKNETPEIYIEPGKKTTDRSGHNESEVGVFYFTAENTVERFSHFFNIFHNRYCDQVEAAFGIDGLERINVN